MKMKRLISVFICFVMAAALFAPAAFAENEWDETYYRAGDTSGELSEYERKSLDENCLETVKKYHIDVALLAVVPTDYPDATLDQLAEWYYTNSKFGYGENRDGLMVVFDKETEEISILRFGSAKEIFPDSYIDFIKGKIPGFREQYGLYGVLYAGVQFPTNYLEEHGTGTEPKQEAPVEAPTEPTEAPQFTEPAIKPEESSEPPVPTSAAWPDWYPDDPENFVFFQDATAPRVVDEADIFTPDEEAQMLERIEQIKNDFSKDVVIYTSDTSYGLGEVTLAQDFYDFNGYGFGDSWEGLCLCVVMDPSNRGVATSATGEVTEALYTMYNSELIDEALFEYFRDKQPEIGVTIPGDYGAGVIDWLDNIHMMYLKGHPFAPEWYPELGKEDIIPASPMLPRVTDEVGTIPEEQLAELNKRANELSEKLGVDVVVRVAKEIYWMNVDEYTDSYYKYNGFGRGEKRSGMELFIRPGHGLTKIYCFGDKPERLNLKELNRVLTQVNLREDGNNEYKAVDRYLDRLEGISKNGIVPYTAFRWIFITICDAALGLFCGYKALEKAKVHMAVPAEKGDAAAYVVPGSVKISGKDDSFVTTHTSRTYSPVQVYTPSDSGSSRSSGGGSSFRSSSHHTYSSSSHGSSGRSHTTSSFKF